MPLLKFTDQIASVLIVHIVLHMCACMQYLQNCKYIAHMPTHFTQHSAIHLSVEARMVSMFICNGSTALPSGKCAGLPRLLAKECLHRV